MELEVVKLVLSALALLLTGFKSIQFVQEGEEGCILRFGKVTLRNGKPRVVKPGFIFLFPFVDKLKRRHVRQETIRFKEQEILIKGNLVFVISAIIRFQIRDVYKALFVIDELENSLAHFVSGLLRDVIQGRTPEELMDTESISEDLMEALGLLQNDWGVEFHDSKLSSCAPTPQSAKLITIYEEGKRRADTAMKLKADYAELDGILPALVGVPITMTPG